MKKIWWVLISIGISIFFLLLILFVPVIWLDQSWWWLGIIAMVEAVIWAIIGLIFLILSRKKTPQISKITIKDEKEKARQFVLMDEDNPDNFIITKTLLAKEGEPGKERTPVAVFTGHGTELNTNINVISNLNSKDERLRIDGVSEDYLKEVMRKIAENPEEKVTSEIIRSLDQFGRPSEVTRTTKSSQAEKEKQEEKERAEKANVL